MLSIGSAANACAVVETWLLPCEANAGACSVLVAALNHVNLGDFPEPLGWMRHEFQGYMYCASQHPSYIIIRPSALGLSSNQVVLFRDVFNVPVNSSAAFRLQSGTPAMRMLTGLLTHEIKGASREYIWGDLGQAYCTDCRWDDEPFGSPFKDCRVIVDYLLPDNKDPTCTCCYARGLKCTWPPVDLDSDNQEQ